MEKQNNVPQSVPYEHHKWLILIDEAKSVAELRQILTDFEKVKKQYPLMIIRDVIYPAVNTKYFSFKESDLPTDAEIQWAIQILNAAGGFQIIRKNEKDADILL